MKTYFLMLVFLCTQLQNSFSQTALEILQKTVIASGGDVWQQPATLSLQGTATFTPFGKTDTAHLRFFNTYSMYRIYPTENTAAHQANGKIRFDAMAGDRMFMQLIYDGKQTTNQMSEEAKKYQVYFSWSNNFGFGIIRYADRDSFRVERLADDRVDGFDCYTVQITDPKKMVTNFQIDQKSFLIRGVSFITSVGFHNRVYSKFKKIKTANGFFMQPGSVKLFFDGIRWMDIQWIQHKVNEPISANIFTQTAN